jgi:hypothetical protein
MCSCNSSVQQISSCRTHQQDNVRCALPQVFFVSIIFLHNHNSMAYVHSTIVYSLEAPAGWLQSTSRTTVRGVIIKSGEDITRAAVTATTTTTTVATQAADDSSSTQKTSGRPHLKRSIASSMLGHLSQHSAVHAAQLAAATAKAELPPNSVQSGIELQPQQVAQVVQQAKAAEQVQQMTDQGAATEATTAAEKYAVSVAAGAPLFCLSKGVIVLLGVSVALPRLPVAVQLLGISWCNCLLQSKHLALVAGWQMLYLFYVP